MPRLYKSFFTSLILLLSVTPCAFAGKQSDTITAEMVAEKYSKLEKLLNEHAEYEKLIHFLHDHISEDAVFRVTVTNPAMPQPADEQLLELGKSDYINSYIQGTHYIDRYEMNINTIDFKHTTDGAISLEVMTERGLMADPANPSPARGRPFISRTTCRTHHKIEDKKLIATASECHTDVSFEEEI